MTKEIGTHDFSDNYLYMKLDYLEDMIYYLYKADSKKEKKECYNECIDSINKLKKIAKEINYD